MNEVQLRPAGGVAEVSEDHVLAMVDAGRAELERAVAAGDPAMVAQVAKRAEAIRYLSKKAGLALGASNAAARLKVDAERRAGTMLREATVAGEYGPGKPPLAGDLPSFQRLHEWQDMARVSEEEVQAYLKSREDKQAEITSVAIQHMGARVRRMEKITEKQASYDETPPDERPVSVIYADPPWRYDFAVSDSRKIENQYPTMDVAEIAKVDPAPAEDAVLFLWVTSPKLREGLEIMQAWGFTYKTSMVWVKPQIGMGYYARSQHELLLIGSLGVLPSPQPDARPSFSTSLAYSHDQADQPWWETVYRRAFPDFAAMVDLRHDGWHQRAGRDRAVMLTSGSVIHIDEKVRSKAYDDVAIEVWSTYPKSGSVPYPPAAGAKPGWAREPKDCDWLAYAFEPTHICYLFPFLGVRAAWAKHARSWIDLATAETQGFEWARAENRTYNTISIAVPIWILQGAIADAMTIDWKESA